MQYFTDRQAHNIELRQDRAGQELKLNE